MYVIIKLNTNDEVIGKLSITDENSINLKGALAIRYGFSYESDPTVYLEKYCLFTKDYDIIVDNKDIMHIFKDPVDSIVSLYVETLQKMKNRPLISVGVKKENKTYDDFDHPDDYKKVH